MKKMKKSTKRSFDSVIKEVPAIHELYNAFLAKGFTTEQAYGLTINVLNLVLK
jgi:hypothetical protein